MIPDWLNGTGIIGIVVFLLGMAFTIAVVKLMELGAINADPASLLIVGGCTVAYAGALILGTSGLWAL